MNEISERKNSFTSKSNLLEQDIKIKIIKDYELSTLQQVDRYCGHFSVFDTFSCLVLLSSHVLKCFIK